ncbi:MAG: MarR family transcriptional regulator [Thalassobius sp.]|nr:MarR family transcriptional regulator [Thalassovita sp.]
MKTSQESLWLENQLCFPLYAVSRMVTKLYTPFLEKLDITYPQYLVLLVLWKEDQITVSDISEQLYLESNTLTPLLKRMEKKELICRERSKEDERKVVIALTRKGQELQKEAECVPTSIIEQFKSDDVKANEVVELKLTLNKLLNMFDRKLSEKTV